MLQTCALVSLGAATPLNVFSIVVAALVIASKGYLVAYSIDRATFGFNVACVAADVFALFACATWLAHRHAAGAAGDDGGGGAAGAGLLFLAPSALGGGGGGGGRGVLERCDLSFEPLLLLARFALELSLPL